MIGLLGFLNPKNLILGAIIIALGYAFYIATDRIILQQEIKNLKATEAQNHERKKTDETIRNADDARLCELLGGKLSDQGICE
jgi:hypothetical protein